MGKTSVKITPLDGNVSSVSRVKKSLTAPGKRVKVVKPRKKDKVTKDKIPPAPVIKTKIKNTTTTTEPDSTSNAAEIAIVTRAGIRRCATRAGVRCIQKEAMNNLQKTVANMADELLVRARSNAHFICRAKTLRMADIASAARIMGLGELVCHQ